MVRQALPASALIVAALCLSGCDGDKTVPVQVGSCIAGIDSTVATWEAKVIVKSFEPQDLSGAQKLTVNFNIVRGPGSPEEPGSATCIYNAGAEVPYVVAWDNQKLIGFQELMGGLQLELMVGSQGLSDYYLQRTSFDIPGYQREVRVPHSWSAFDLVHRGTTAS